MEKSAVQSTQSDDQTYSRYHKICSPAQYFAIYKKISNNKTKLLKQLEQLDIDTTELRTADIKVVQEKCEQLLRNSYSFKYIGIKDNQIGILSKRVRPDAFNSELLPKIENLRAVTGFFYPKPLRTIRSSKQKHLTTDNLENEIKRYFPKHDLKVLDHNIKVRGSWNNLKCKGKQPAHLKNSNCDLKEPTSSQICNSYSRSLQKRGILHERSQSIQQE